jgi:N-acetylmuramoyl-L-alanine amidase
MSNSQRLDYLFLHCSDTPAGREITKDEIIRWHTLPVHLNGRGWNRPGYADLVYLNGELVNLIPFNTDDFVDLWEVSNGVQGLNGCSRHICYVGGADKDDPRKKVDTRTAEQKHTLEIYVKYTILRHPHIQVLGHRQAPNAKGKECPSFDVPTWLREINVPERNIYPAHSLKAS